MNMLASSNRVVGNTLVTCDQVWVHTIHWPAGWVSSRSFQLGDAGTDCDLGHVTTPSVHLQFLHLWMPRIWIKLSWRASSRLANKNNSSNQWHWQDIFYCNYRDQAFLLSGYTRSGNEASPLSFIFFPTYFCPPLSPVLSKTITGPAKAIVLWGVPMLDCVCVDGSMVKNPPANAGDMGLIPGWGRSPGEGNGNPLQYSCLGNPMDKGAWWAIDHGLAKSRTRLSDWTKTTCLAERRKWRCFT